MNIQWPPNKITDLAQLRAMHTALVPPFVGHVYPYVPSINLGHLANACLTDPGPKPVANPQYVVDIADALVYKGADFIISNTAAVGGALLYHESIDFVVSFGEWSNVHPQMPTDEAVILKGSTLLIGGTWEENYYHFIFETIGRCCSFEKFCYSFADVDRIVVSQVPNNVKWEWFKYLGIADKIMVAPESFMYCERLILPSLSSNGITKETITYLRNRISPRRGESRRIFVTRGHASNGRNLVNEDLFFTKLLKPHGFEKVIMDSMSLADQANLIFSARAIVALHGGALSNLVFAAPQSHVLEIFGESYVTGAFLHLANQSRLKHFHIICPEVNQRGHFSDYEIDLEQIDLHPFLQD